ncbi:hypothetical protein NEOLEDRAFT_1083032 [Neolentinus lepideus HHB14362 ss-1]|uniref:Protein YOP1 n=1 Tax=Neolentinus lepideus HHB14362 ss-1 TaxID=1314782 RepID=A0A165W635_9AGAM|nr:hypothetical protein NEOLEDRAFT_1083032 [Neolentinus lepideus HHB14362 ss-1]
MFVVCHVISAWFAFFLPCYSTFKALAHRPLSEPELERWAMYWCVVGAFVTVEYAVEWLVDWFPFYYEIKMLFLLFLSLPQTEGSTYVYKTYVEPFFTAKEANIDSGIEAAKTNALTFFQTRLAALWDLLWSIISKTPAAAQKTGADAKENSSSAAANPLVTVQSLWTMYGSVVVGAVQRSTGVAQTTTSAQANGQSPPVHMEAAPNAVPSPLPTPEIKVGMPSPSVADPTV